MPINRGAPLVVFGLLASASASAADPVPALARYLPLYPGLYSTAGYESDDRDSIYRQDGSKTDNAAPNAGGTGSTAFPTKAYTADFRWYFPMWEADDFPFFSSRLHTARVHLRHADTRTNGRLAAFAADSSDDNYTDADHLENNGSGVGDLVLEFGSVLYGSPDWRNGERSTFSVTGTVGVTLPFGEYNRDAPINVGDNAPAAQLLLGASWQPWNGGFVDAGVSRREFFQNYDAAFGQLSPTERGDEAAWDLSLAQRVLPGLYLGLFADRRHGDPNGYENPRFAPNAPPPPGNSTSNEPVPGLYYDGGTALTRYGLSVNYFFAQNWLAGIYYARPRSGKSGEFLLPFENHNPGGCTAGASGCSVTPGDTILVDGLGAARTYASTAIRFTVTYSFGQGDAFTCRGCETN